VCSASPSLSVVSLLTPSSQKPAPERAKGLGPRLGLAGWSFFVYLHGLRKVRSRRFFLRRHRSVFAGKIYTDLTSAVSG
jgi:hypothetical protein